MSGELCSADLTTLLAFVTTSKSGREALAGDIAALSAAWDGALAACEFRDVENNPGPDIVNTMDNIHTNEEWVRTIHDTLVNAPMQNGVSVAPSEQIDAAVQENGTAPTSEVVEYDPPEMVGEPVTSGLVNDPINAATGNFVHADRDIQTPGFGAVLDVVRTYNSLATDRRGLFGIGWTTLLDVGIEAQSDGDSDSDGDSALVTFTDGSQITFTRDDRGEWRPNLRRRLRLQTTETGWTLSRHHGERIWHFDTEGRLIGGEEGAARYAVSYGDDAITVDEAQSGRSARYTLGTGADDGLVVGVETSDGRGCTYAYEDGHCVHVGRVIGDITYEIDDGFVVAIFDADGVLQARNIYDDRGRVTGQESEHGRRTEFVYGDDGSTRITDDSGGPTNVLFHDKRANLQSMIGGNGAAMRASFDRHDRIVQHTDREGGVTRYEYHPDTDLDVIVRTTDPDGLFEEHDYDELGRMTRRVDRGGGVWIHEYDGERREPSRIAGPEGYKLDVVFDDRDLPIRSVDADGVETICEWDADGQLARVTNGLGESTTLTYDPTGQLTAIHDPLGRAATFELDDTGRVRTITDVDGLVNTVDYSPAGRVLAMVNDGPGSFTATYDDRGNLAAFTDATGSTVGFFHNQSGQLVEIAGPDGAVTTQEFDAMGQLAAVVDPAGNRATQQYDREGRSISTTDYHGRTFRRDVDELGRTTEIVGPDGARLERTYHPTGELASTTDPLDRRWTFDIDGLGRLVAETDPEGGRTTYEYSPGSRLIRMVTPAGREYRYGYDEAGRPMTMVDADGIEYGVAGNELDDAAAAAFAEQMARFQIDELGRVTGWQRDDPTDAPAQPDADTSVSRLELGPLAMLQARGDDHPSQFEYDQRGLLQSVTDPAGATTEILRDVRGRVIGRATGEQSTRVDYEASGAVSRLTATDGRTLALNNTLAGRLESVIVEGSDIGRAFTYDDAGRVASVQCNSDGMGVQYEYDPLGLLTAATTTGAESSRALVGHDLYGSIAAVIGEAGPDTTYLRDADGLVVQRVEVDGHTTDYDRTPAGRLVGFTDTAAGVVGLPQPGSVDRDRAGRITIDEHGRTYVYDVAGRIAEAITSSGHQWFTYNDLGLLATDRDEQRQRTFTYDIGGRLVRVDESDDSGTRHTEFAYDAAGRRSSQRSSDGGEVEFRWNDLDQLVSIVRTAPDGSVTTRRVQFSGLGRPDLVDDLAIGWDDAMVFKPVRIGEQRFLRSGMHVRLAEPDSEWFDGTFDDPWGFDESRLDGVGLGYRGELTIDGLVFMGDRVYDPATRAFLSHDPLPPVPGENGAYASPYSYSWCDPVNFVDPSGREPITVEEFDAWKEKQETNRFERAAQAMADDPWGTLAMVGVIAAGTLMVATGVGAGIGVGILVGAGMSMAMGLATDNFSPRSVAISGAFGGVTGGGVGGAFAAGFGESAVTQVLVDGKGFDDIDWGDAAIGGATGGAMAGGGAVVGKAFKAGAKRFKGPAGDVAPSVPRARNVGGEPVYPAGISLNNPHPVGAPDPMFSSAARRPDVDVHEGRQVFDIVAHGGPDHMVAWSSRQARHINANHRQIASKLRATPAWADNPREVRLLSCNTGSHPEGIAQRLADEIRQPVTAPSTPVAFDLQGRHRLRQVRVEIGFGGRPFNIVDEAAPPGEWRTFYPRPVNAVPVPAGGPAPAVAVAPEPPPMMQPAPLDPVPPVRRNPHRPGRDTRPFVG